MKFYSELARSIIPYTAGEQPQDKKYVKLNTNENPYSPSPAVAKAIAEFETQKLRLYPRPNADLLRDAIARVEGVARENVFCGNGSDEVLALCVPAFFDKDGKGACFADITYSFYEVFARFFNVPTKIVPLKEDFSLDLQTMQGVDCAGYLIANPNAPTGVGIPREIMQEFLRAVPDKLVIADEAYMDFYGESLAALVNEYPNLLVVKTFSKSYSLAGIRCGYAVGSSQLIEALFRMKDCFNSYPVDALCQVICAAAVEDRAYHEKATRLVVEERERLREQLLNLGFIVPQSGANFLFAGRAKLSGEQIYKKLKERGVLVRFWNKPVLCDFCRITVGTKEENDILIKNLKEILA